MKDDLLKAIDSALAGEWDVAHGIVQHLEGNRTAAWIHAVLHKMEGDLSNSSYWYERSGKREHLADEPRGELALIRGEVQSQT